MLISEDLKKIVNLLEEDMDKKERILMQMKALIDNSHETLKEAVKLIYQGENHEAKKKLEQIRNNILNREKEANEIGVIDMSQQRHILSLERML